MYLTNLIKRHLCIIDHIFKTNIPNKGGYVLSKGHESGTTIMCSEVKQNVST